MWGPQRTEKQSGVLTPWVSNQYNVVPQEKKREREKGKGERNRKKKREEEGEKGEMRAKRADRKVTQNGSLKRTLLSEE